MARKDKENQEPGFEDALKRLEELVSRMESGTMGLDEMVGAFEEGQRLIAVCSAKLNEVERKIEMLVKDDAGKITAQPFAAMDGNEPETP
jgi:exodeoxyribonuclease VII small subunit